MRKVLGNVLILLLSLALGLLVFGAVQRLIELVWGIDGAFDGFPPVAVMLVLPVAAAAVVGWARTRANGHNPMAGLAVGPVAAADYPFLLLGIVAGLVGGAVLGPEVAMLVTGGFIAALLAPRFDLPLKNSAVIGGLGGLLALFVGPALTGSTSPPTYAFTGSDVPAAVLGAIVGVGLVNAARAGARLISRPDDVVSFPLLLGGGLAVGLMGLAYQSLAQESARLVLTSGEHMISSVVSLGSVALILWTVAVKMLAYAVSMGAGFRGGPYFPAMFAGAGAGAAAAALVGGSAYAAATAGLIATMTHLAMLRWPISIVASLAIGLLVGGPTMLPMALLGGVIGRLVPTIVAREPSR